MVVSGGAPDLSEAPGIILTPINDEQEYVRDVINKHFPEFKPEQTWSVSDQSRTFQLVQKKFTDLDKGEHGSGVAFIRLIGACASAGCKIFLWWTDAIIGDGFRRNIRKASDIRELHKIIITQQETDGNICVYWQPWRPS